MGESEIVNQPYGGTTFTSHGHYGSTVFDPLAESVFLEINVCDECLVESASERVLRGRPTRPERPSYEPWEPEHPTEKVEEPQ